MSTAAAWVSRSLDWRARPRYACTSRPSSASIKGRISSLPNRRAAQARARVRSAVLVGRQGPIDLREELRPPLHMPILDPRKAFEELAPLTIPFRGGHRAIQESGVAFVAVVRIPVLVRLRFLGRRG